METFSCQLLLLTIVVLTARAQSTSEPPSVPDPHRHPVPVHQQPWRNELAPNARFVSIDTALIGHDTTPSPNHRWLAFVCDRPEDQSARVCVQEAQTGRQYKLRGIPLPYRPISGLIWLNDTLLTFDRWSQPHYGVHYVVDVRRLCVVLSTPFPDEFMFRSQGVLKDTAKPHR
jgi:hypothetical protein